MITYRWLEPNERGQLQPVFEEHGGAMPSPNLSAIAAAINDEGKVVGFHVVQLCPHAEPKWTDPEYRGKVSWRELQKLIESLFASGTPGQYFTFVDNDRMAKLCKRGGMEELPMRIFRKSVG